MSHSFTFRKKFATLLFSVFASLLSLSTPSLAQWGDRCEEYARIMVTQNQQARQMRCQGWSGHSNSQDHYNWCQDRSHRAAQNAISQSGARLQACQFSGNQGHGRYVDPNLCNSYANEMVNIAHHGHQTCHRWNGDTNFNNHNSWCHRQSPERVNQAINEWRHRLRSC